MILFRLCFTLVYIIEYYSVEIIYFSTIIRVCSIPMKMRRIPSKKLRYHRDKWTRFTLKTLQV